MVTEMRSGLSADERVVVGRCDDVVFRTGIGILKRLRKACSRLGIPFEFIRFHYAVGVLEIVDFGLLFGAPEPWSKSSTSQIVEFQSFRYYPVFPQRSGLYRRPKLDGGEVVDP